MKSLFVVNARSGPVRGRDMASLIRASCSLDHDIVATERKEDLDRVVAEAQRNGFEAVIAVGGDGTVHEVAKRLIGTDLALGIVPTGSGNGFARHHQIPMRISAAVRMLASSKRITIDTAEVNGKPFIGVMGIGYAAHIAHRFAELPQRGFRSYVRAALSAFRSYQCEEYEISIDGGEKRYRAFLVEIANTAHWGNNFRIAPQASVLDGALDVVIVDPISLFEAPLFGTRLRFGSVHRSRRVATHRTAEVTIRVIDSVPSPRRNDGERGAGVRGDFRRNHGPSPQPLSPLRGARGPTAVHLDGEPLAMERELYIRVRRGSLTVLVPRDAVVI